jgi:hypothetical protein
LKIRENIGENESAASVMKIGMREEAENETGRNMKITMKILMKMMKSIGYVYETSYRKPKAQWRKYQRNQRPVMAVAVSMAKYQCIWRKWRKCICLAKLIIADGWPAAHQRSVAKSGMWPKTIVAWLSSWRSCKRESYQP